MKYNLHVRLFKHKQQQYMESNGSPSSMSVALRYRSVAVAERTMIDPLRAMGGSLHATT